MIDLDELIRDGLTEEARRARFDRDRWAPSVTRLPAPRRPRFLTSVRGPRTLAGLAAAAVLVAAIALPLVLLSRLGTGPREGRTTGRAVDRYGVHLDLPAGWDSRTFQSGDTRYVLLANFEIPPGGVVSPADLREGLGADQVTVFLQDLTEICPCGGFEQLQGPASITPSDMTSFEGVPNEHAFGRRTFVASGRSFDLWVEFGSRPAPTAVLGDVNDVLATLRITPESGWVVHEDRNDGVRISTPATWTWREDPVPNLGEPRILFAAGTWDFPVGGQCGPNPALEDLPADGAFVWLLEYRIPGRLGDFPPRPYPLSLSGEPVVPECSTAHPSYLLRFRDGFRFFQFHVALGDAATEATRRDVVDVLNSMWPGGLSQDETLARALALCDHLPWVQCPMADWVRNTIWDAGFRVEGATESAVVGTADGSSFFMWTTRDRAEPLEASYAPIMEVDGVTVRSDGTRAVWATRGIRVWVEAGPTDSALPSQEQLEALVRASLRTRF